MHWDNPGLTLEPASGPPAKASQRSEEHTGDFSWVQAGRRRMGRKSGGTVDTNNEVPQKAPHQHHLPYCKLSGKRSSNL